MKIEKDLEIAKNPTAIKIAKELIKRSEQDPLIRASISKENKSMDEMLKYVRSEAQKLAVDGCTEIDDDNIVYGWAQHFYDEDDIMKKEKSITKPVKEEVKEIELPEDDLDMFDL